MKCPLSLLQMPVKTFHESSDQPNSQFSRTFWQGLCWFLVKNKFGSLAFCYRHPKYALTLGRHKKITSASASDYNEATIKSPKSLVVSCKERPKGSVWLVSNNARVWSIIIGKVLDF